MMKSMVLLGVAITAVVFLSVDYLGWSDGPARRSLTTNTNSTDEIYAAGIVEGTTSEIQLRTEIAGRIANVLVAEGQWVNKGELLVEIANDDYRYRITLATANLNRAQAELQKLLNGARRFERDELSSLYDAGVAEYQRAEKTWLAVKRLEKSNATTVEEVDHHFFRLNRLRSEVAAAKARLDLVNADPREEDVNIAKARVATANAELDSARNKFNKTLLLAPSAGRILDLNLRAGETTGPDSIEPTLIMADTSQLFVVAYLEEYDAMRVNANCRIRISASGLDSEIAGELESLSPIMKRKEISSLQPDELHDVRTRKVRIKLDDDAGLIVGLPVDVYFENLN